MTASTKPFIRVTEIWLPDASGERLAFGGGLYGGLDDFRALSEGTSFARDEGLPGKAWAARHPIVLKGFEGSYFRRTAAATAAGLTCGVALPIFAGEAIRAVVVFFCGDDAEHVGAIEVWRRDPRLEAQIGLVDGYYGTAELFEITSKMTRFGKGHGLPGLVWQSGMPEIVPELYSASRFLRREEALKVGLTSGLGIPVDSDPGTTWVMAFLSALGTPIARRFEVWLPDDGGRLLFGSGLCDAGADLVAEYGPGGIGPGDGLVGEVLARGLPAVADAPTGEPEPIAASLAAAGLASGVGIPVLDGAGRLKAAVAWRF